MRAALAAGDARCVQRRKVILSVGDGLEWNTFQASQAPGNKEMI